MAKKSETTTPRKKTPFVTYTLRNKIPRPLWDRFRQRLTGEGHNVNWAFMKFIESYADRVITFDAASGDRG